MNLFRLQPLKTHLNISLRDYVVCVQQQMKQPDGLLVNPGKTAEQQIKREQFFSRHLSR